MKIFEFQSSFIVIDKIRCVIIEPVKKIVGKVTICDELVADHFQLRIVYDNDSALLVLCADEDSANDLYSKLMGEVMRNA